MLSRDFTVKQQQSNEETRNITKMAAVMSRPPRETSPVSPVQRLCTSDARSQNQARPEDHPASGGGGGLNIEQQPSLHAISDLTGSGVHKETGFSFYFEKLSSRGLTT